MILSPADNKKFAFIVNPRAGISEGRTLEELIRQHSSLHHATFEIFYTQSRGHATELALASSREGYDFVIAVGGDGTVNEVAQGLMGTSTIMGIVPKGSGNGLARHLGIPLNVAQSVSALFSSEVLAMDVFTINGRLSLNVSGIGFDGHVTNLFGVKSGRGLLGYVKITAQEFTTFREFSADIQANNERFKRNAFIIAIANSSQYGNNAYIAPTASVCDGLLHVNILKKIPVYRMDFLYDFFSGRVGNSPYSEIIETAALELTTSTPVSYHVDGEPAGQADQFTVILRPAALNVLHPPLSKTRI